MRRLIRTAWTGALLLSAAFYISACVQGQRATDVGDPGFPFGPSAIAVRTVAYVQDIQPIFNSDCVPCHGARSPAARYSMATYAGVMAAVAPGNASSALVIVTQSGGAMHAFLSGDQAGKAAMIRTWVMNGTLQSR